MLVSWLMPPSRSPFLFGWYIPCFFNVPHFLHCLRISYTLFSPFPVLGDSFLSICLPSTVSTFHLWSTPFVFLCFPSHCPYMLPDPLSLRAYHLTVFTWVSSYCFYMVIVFPWLLSHCPYMLTTVLTYHSILILNIWSLWSIVLWSHWIRVDSVIIRSSNKK